jgi:hypothetical protein
MSVSKYKTWLQNEVLTSADLNASFDQVFNNQQDLGFPRTSSADFNGVEIIIDADGDTSLRETSDDVLVLKMAGQDLFIFDGDGASAVNGLRFTAGATIVTVGAQGTSANVDLTLAAKGTGNINFTTDLVDLNGAWLVLDADGDSSLREVSDDVIYLKLQNQDVFIFDGDAASAVNGLTFRSAAAGSDVQIEGQGASADVNVAIVPKGAGVVKLGTATVTATPTAGAVPVANGSGKLAVGWIAGGAVLLATYTPSGAASVDITSVISATYGKYRIDIDGLTPATDGALMLLRTDQANGASFDAGASDYASHVVVSSGTSTLTGVGSNAAASIGISAEASGLGNSTAEGISGSIWIDAVGSASRLPSFSWNVSVVNPSTAHLAVSGSGVRLTTAAINAVQLLMSAGNLTGTVRVYGIAVA